MPPKDHRRTHNLLLISRLLNLRDPVSPFTLILDSLSQSAKPLIDEYISRSSSAQAAKCAIVFVSFETFRPPAAVSTLITARRKPVAQLQAEVAQACTGRRTLLILDSLNSLAPSSLAPFLSGLLSPTTSLLAVYHLDAPPAAAAAADADYHPHPVTLLRYFATTLLTTHSITHMLAAKAARDRSLAPPVFGLDEGVEGGLVALGANPAEGMVLEMEYRRKSGRGVCEWFFLPLAAGVVKPGVLPGGVAEKVVLLEDHPLWRASEGGGGAGGGGGAPVEDSDGPTSTFELGLTDAQREARDQVVLPYYDAQREGGIGGGGAILFTPDREIDDFDDEEDEI